MSGIFENTLCNIPFQGNYLATASATANTLDIASKAALIEREGLRFDGTAGAVIGGGGIPAVGTGGFTIITQVNRDGSIIRLCGGAAGSINVYTSSSSIVVGKSGVSEDSTVNCTVPVKCIIAVVRQSGVITAYVDGVAAGSVAGASNYTSPTIFLNADITQLNSVFAGNLTNYTSFNYALTQSEITALIGRGLVNLPEQNGGSMVALNTSSWVNSANAYTTFTGVSATGFSATFTPGTFAIAYSAPNFPARIGQQFRVNFTLTLISGTAPTFSLGAYGVGGNSANYATTNGANVFTIPITSSSTAVQAQFYSASTLTNFTVSNFSIIPLGTLFEQDSGQRNAGYTVRDTSGNNLDLILPATGISVIDPANRGTIRFTTTTSGNQQIGGSQVIIPTNARISSWVINANGTPNVTLGNVSAGAQYRASAAVVSGDNQITLLTPFASTGNLWVNSSTTATLKHTIQWEYIQ